MIRSPVNIPAGTVNEPLDARARAILAERSRASSSRRAVVPHGWISETERFDTFADLDRRHTVVMVCISGGGAHAAAFARHVMGELEAIYNSTNPNPERHLIESIDAYSTVSGGSIYGSFVALQHLREEARGRAEKRQRSKATFQDLRKDRFARLGTAHLGWHTTGVYLSPGNLFLPPLRNLFTDQTNLNVVAHGLRVLHTRGKMRPAAGYRLGDLEQAPRFYFNSACLETGTPFVITQSLIHLPSETPPRPTARIDALIASEKRSRTQGFSVPLARALTLENINSSAAKYPLAYAAVASMAFPIGMDPLPIRKYRYVASPSAVRASDTVLHLTDGGALDYSGLDTAVRLFEHLVATRNVKRLVLLHISAENDEYDLDAATAPGRPFWWPRYLMPGTIFPIRGLTGGFKAIKLLHFINKRRAREMALRRLERLKEREKGKGVDYCYFPVRLSQLSPRDRYPIRGGEKAWRNIKRINTDYTIGPEEDRHLSEAAKLLLSTPQSGRRGAKAEGRAKEGEESLSCRVGLGWRVGPKLRQIDQLGLAFAYAVVRAHLDAWHDERQEPNW